MLLSIAFFLLSYFSKEILNTEDLVINSLAEQLTNEQIQEVLGFKKNWEWVSYFLFPLLLLIKTSIIAVIIDVGCFFFGKEIKYRNNT